MKRTVLSVFLLFIVYTSLSQSKVFIKGSFSIAAICKDGIVIGEDSRGSFFTGRDSILGYFDNVQKVFIVKNCALSIVG